MYVGADGQVTKDSMNGPLAAGIPGMPAALDHLARRYGRLPLQASLAPAIRYAGDGFRVDGWMHAELWWRRATLKKSPAAGFPIGVPDTCAQPQPTAANKGSKEPYEYLTNVTTADILPGEGCETGSDASHTSVDACITSKQVCEPFWCDLADQRTVGQRARRAFLFGGGLSSTNYAIVYGQKNYSAWSPPLWPIKVVMTAAIFMMLLQCVSALFKDIAIARGKPLA